MNIKKFEMLKILLDCLENENYFHWRMTKQVKRSMSLVYIGPNKNNTKFSGDSVNEKKLAIFKILRSIK